MKPVKISGMPLNVVPIPTTVTIAKCKLNNSQKQQVIVAPNFAMTDYASLQKNLPAQCGPFDTV